MDSDLTRTQPGLSDPPSAEPEALPREPNGRFRAGHPGPNLRHGLRSQLAMNGKLIEASEKLVAQRDAYQRGDREALKQTIANSLSATDYLLGGLGPRIALEGPISAKGRMRAAVSVFIRLSEHKLRLAQVLLSLEPSKPDAPPADYSHLTDEELDAVNAILAAARARASAAPVEEPPTPTTRLRIEVPAND
ncbi:MAG: hypothetical protein AB7H93_16765 [Vicinamibacterales bacterium]